MSHEPERRELDWPELHARLRRAAEVSTCLLEPAEDDVRRILTVRARELARRVAAPTFSGTELELAFFSVDDEEFAIEARHVLEVAILPEIEAVPLVPPVFRGVANHRGDVLPIVDLSALLTGTARAAQGKWMLVLGSAHPELALSIDAAEEVATVAIEAIRREALPGDIASIPFVRGIHLGHRLVVDGDALLADPRLTVRDGA